MANTYTPQDVYAIVNSIVAQATGSTALTAVDTTTFVAVGETLLKTAPENTLNAISNVIAKTIFSVRPYTGSLTSLRVASERWGAMVRKIVTLYSDTEESEDYNTQLNPTQLDDGNSVDMFKIRKPVVMQLNFIGTKKLQKHITIFRDQLSTAFHSEAEFAAFLDAVMVEFNNEIELANESKARALLLNAIAGIKDMNLTVVDLVAEYNTRNNISPALTRQECLDKDHIESFMKFASSQIKIWSNKLTNLSSSYHANLTGYQPILRHTPKARQKMIMYTPYFIESEAQVYSSLFNPQYLDIGSFEGVNFWQSESTPESVNCKPNILDVATGKSVDAAAAVSIDYVLGILYDEDAMGVMPQFDYASTSPFNSAGGYFNSYMHWRWQEYVDYTENMVLFILG